MKRILVPTDFSTPSDKALSYAVQLIKGTEAELFLLHVYAAPEFTENSELILTEQYLEKEALQKLEKMKAAVESSCNGIRVSYDAIPGMVTGVITDYAHGRRADLIVIGAQGAGYLRERVFGSTASALIRLTEVPLMVIGKEVTFREPEKIVLAIDFEETENQAVLKPLLELASRFQSHISLLNVFPDAHTPLSPAEISERLRLENTLKHTSYTFCEVNDPDVIAGITAFISREKSDLAVLISRNHSLLSRLFREPVTAAMTFHSQVPLLILHE